MPLLPPERDAVLVIDSNAVAARLIASQPFQAVARGDGELNESRRAVQYLQFSLSASPERPGNSSSGAGVLFAKEIGGRLVTERLNHCNYMLHE